MTVTRYCCLKKKVLSKKETLDILGQHEGSHGLHDGESARDNAGVVSALGLQHSVLRGKINA